MSSHCGLCCVSRYTTGQHFLAHEDGFPPLLANSNGFQRHATLLLYLNDVQQVTHSDSCWWWQGGSVQHQACHAAPVVVVLDRQVEG
jgi:hypothetical protein